MLWCCIWPGVPNSCNSKVFVPWHIPGIGPGVSSRSVVELDTPGPISGMSHDTNILELHE
jgi:hypothetical protein